MTAIVGPPSAAAAACAAPSIPTASPDTTVAPARTSARRDARGDEAAVRGRPARSDEGDGRRRVKGFAGSSNEQDVRRELDRRQAPRIRRLLEGDDAEIGGRDPLED